MYLDGGRYRMGSVALPKIINDQELGLLIQAVQAIMSDPLYWEAMIYCATDVGLREGECSRLKIEHIDFIERTMLIVKQKNGNDNEKIIPSDFLLEKLKEHINANKTHIDYNDGYLFYGRTKKRGPITVEGIRKRFTDIREKAGLTRIYGYTKPIFKITNTTDQPQVFKRFEYKRRKKKPKITKIEIKPGEFIRTSKIEARNSAQKFKMEKVEDGRKKYVVSFHTLRHYFCQRLTDADCQQHKIQQASRHRSEKSLKRYQHTSLKHKRQVMEQAFNNPSSNVNDEVRDLKVQVQKLTEMLSKSIVVPRQSNAPEEHAPHPNAAFS